MPEEEIFRQRKEKLFRLREEGYDPFSIDKFDRQHSVGYVRERYDHLAPDQEGEELLSVAGRIMTLRRHGKASFATLEEDSGRIQLYFQLDQLGEESYGFFKKWVDTGDILGVNGRAFRTQRGELSIKVTEFKLLTKALRPLPEKWHGLKDQEVRYRQRYLDLMVNPEVRETFRKRTRIIQTVRRVMESHGTLEVTTPILSTLAGGPTPGPS